MWSIELLRLTSYPSPDAIIKDPDWWNTLVGELPESRISQPKIGGIKESGPYNNGILTLDMNPSKLNWTYKPVESAENPFPKFEDYKETLKSFSELMKKWFELNDCPTTRRLAFGAQFSLEVGNKVDGYKSLGKYLHNVKIDPDGSSELFYQINRPRLIPLNETKISINRLTKWHIQSVQLFRMEFPKGSQTRMGKEVHFCKLEVDINTDNYFEGTFSNQAQKQLWNILQENGVEITEKGDIP
jgi:hypothetical protein